MLTALRIAVFVPASLAAVFICGSAYSADFLPAQAETVPIRRVDFVAAAAPAAPQNSIFVFAGRLSTTAMGDTALFNLGFDGQGYDNFVAGIAYQRDLWRWHGFVIAAEVGVADRFGHYRVCCTIAAERGSLVQSGELWGAAAMRFEFAPLFNTIRISPGFAIGLSGTTNSIGREREREITRHGNARVLGYLGPEIAMSLVDFPNLELVMRLHHRSGANGTFGKVQEGYNAYVFGGRWRF